MNIHASRNTYVTVLLTIISLFTVKFAMAQLEGDQLKDVIDSKNFSFTVTHESGGDFALGNYYLHIVNDSLSVMLPYSGRSGTASYTVDDNGINIHTKDFTYQATLLKNLNYTIRIALNNDRSTKSFSLQVNKKGIAMLVANSINRENSVYTGVIQSL